MTAAATTSRIFAIGDVHGCHDRLVRLLEMLPYEPARDTLVFLGDYIDRGRQSREVVSLICSLQKRGSRVITLLGNHEHLLLQYHRTGDQSLVPLLRKAGIESLLESYALRSFHALLDFSGLPADHRRFFLNLLPYWESETHLFVHAGLEPGLAPAAQSSDVLTGIRDVFLHDESDFGKPVVFGHTPFATPLVTPAKIGIDTGAAYGNVLTALELPDLRFYHA